MLLGKHINKYYLRYWYLYLAGVLSLVLVDYVQLYEPVFLGQIVDHISGGNADIAFVSAICIKLLLIAGAMFLGRMLWRFTLFNASQRIEAGMRREMFQKSERLSQYYFHNTKVGSIMSWFTTDLETIEEYTGFGTVQLVDGSFLAILVIARMFALDWVMTLIALIPMMLIVVWGFLVEKFMALRWEDRQEKYDRLYDFAQENFTGIGVIKAFVKETSELHAFAKIAKKNKDANIAFARAHIVFDTLIEVIIALILSLIMGLGSWFVYCALTGSALVVFGHEITLTPGELITFIGFFDTLIWPMIALGSLVSMLGRAKTSLKRVGAFLDAEEDIRNPENAVELKNVKGEIRFQTCSFSYPASPGVEVLKDVSIHIKPGERIGVVGRVGSGKTTLMTLLLRLYNVAPGTVFVDGVDIMDADLDSLRAAVAFVPQDSFLFSDTVRENIAFGREGAGEEDIRAAAEFADVAENIRDFPKQYDTVTGERGVTLSGGQKQRLSLARAYLKDAPILILDDSVSAVDVKTEETILNNIRQMRAGKTTVIIASRVSSVAHADRILVLNEGRVEAFDTPARLQEISPTYQKMVYLQELEKEVKGGRRDG
ncbi:MAG: ABC transporter ATP-binding protein [Clostridia bacterium]|nr:ABC transporter ATP-binding protein [Clostridia bacterium]